MQAPPLRPHFAAVGATQVEPSQHPAAHVVALHGAAQTPLLHTSPIAHAMQLAPPQPHWVSLLPARQAPVVSLQPVVHMIGAHTPLSQAFLIT